VVQAKETFMLFFTLSFQQQWSAKLLFSWLALALNAVK
jgi:hypothetical protein